MGQVLGISDEERNFILSHLKPCKGQQEDIHGRGFQSPSGQWMFVNRDEISLIPAVIAYRYEAGSLCIPTKKEL